MNLINGSGGRSVRKLARSILPQKNPLVNTFLKKFNLQTSYLTFSLIFSLFLSNTRLSFLFFSLPSSKKTPSSHADAKKLRKRGSEYVISYDPLGSQSDVFLIL